VPEDAVPAGGGDRELGARAGRRPEERVLVAHHVADHRDGAGDERPGRARPHLGLPPVRLLPQGPPAGVRGQELEAGQGRPSGGVLPQRNRDHPGGASQLSVGDHVEPGALLQRDRLADRPILRLAEGGGGDPALADPLPGLPQVLRAQQAAHDISAGGRGGRGRAHGRGHDAIRAPHGPLPLQPRPLYHVGTRVVWPPRPTPSLPPAVDGYGDCPLTSRPKGSVRHECVS